MRHRVLSTVYRRWISPERAFLALIGDATDAFWLDSGIHATDGMSYMGVGSRTFIPAPGESVLQFLRAELPAPRAAAPGAATGFALGWVGWLGYERRGETMGVPLRQRSRYPDAAFLYADRILAFDHAARTVTLSALGEPGSRPLEEWRTHVTAVLDGLDDPGPADEDAAVAGPATPVPAVRWAHSDDEYLRMIEACQAHIVRGDAYQLCLTNEAQVDVHPDPVRTYLAMRASSPSHHGGLIRVGDVSLLSATPEVFLTVTPDGIVRSEPIKGTRARGANAQRDAELRAELADSEKERAENLMIVDLMRNDLSRICLPGSVSVPSLLRVETYAHVHQLVSTIVGQLAPGYSGVDALAACFPAGSMTGAPKLGATQILEALEQRPRGVYSGVFGYFGLDGRIELAMVIRSIVLDAEGASIGTGGGITALSVPAEELSEAKLKAAALLEVLGVPL
ncbi:MAG TPA: anthranilate synthase component I family protein [Microbacteriaceae bacterium]